MFLEPLHRRQAGAGVEAEHSERDARLARDELGDVRQIHQAVPTRNPELAHGDGIETEVARNVRCAQHAIRVLGPVDETESLSLAKTPPPAKPEIPSYGSASRPANRTRS